MIVPLLREYPDEYTTREPAGYTNIVMKQDAEVVDVAESDILYLFDYERKTQ